MLKSGRGLPEAVLESLVDRLEVGGTLSTGTHPALSPI